MSIGTGDRIIADGERATIIGFGEHDGVDVMDYRTDAGAEHWMYLNGPNSHRWSVVPKSFQESVS